MADRITNKTILEAIQSFSGNSSGCENRHKQIRTNEMKINNNANDIENLANMIGNTSRLLNKVIWFFTTTLFGVVIVVVLYKIFGVK